MAFSLHVFACFLTCDGDCYSVIEKASAQAAVYTGVYSVAATMIEHYYLMNSFNQRLTDHVNTLSYNY